jgi:hypothetical protein
VPPLTNKADNPGHPDNTDLMQIPDPFLSSTPPAQSLAMMRTRLCDGKITDTVHFQPGFSLHADPALMIDGQFHSPSGRLLELDVTTAGTGEWIALHINIPHTDLSDCAYLGFACRSVAHGQQMIRPCLRSGIGDGFTDSFFNKHILATPEPRDHVDALHIETCRNQPETAPWRELVLFLPTQDFRWHLHDLRLFAQ